MSHIIIGIDPGLQGGIAFISENGYLAEPLPIIRDGALAWVDARELLLLIRGWGELDHPRTVYIERVSAMPRQGVSSSFNFGVGFGSLLGAIQGERLPIKLVSPTKWKREMGLTADKNSALDKARLLFPLASLTRKKDDGLAEALLLAEWGRRQS